MRHTTKLIAFSILSLFIISFVSAQAPERPHNIYGEVTDTDTGNQLQGYTFQVMDSSGNVLSTDVTDGNGFYDMYVSAGSGDSLTVRLEDTSYSSDVTYSSGEVSEVDFSIDSSSVSQSFSVSLNDEEVDEFSSVDLTPDVSNAGSDPSYSWSVVEDPTGAVSLDNENEETVTFNAPSVGFDRTVTIELEVEKSSGSTKTAKADVTVIDTSLPEDTGSGGQGQEDQQSEDELQEQRPEPKNVQAEVTQDPETGRTTAQAQVDNIEENQQVEVEIPDTEEEESTVESVSFTSSSSSDSASVSVSDIGVERPEEVTEDAGSDVYSYQEINIDGVEDDEITEASVNFKVQKSYLEERNRTPEDVVMKRYNGGWDELDTRVDEELENSYRFEASSTGFSYYAIALREEQVQDEGEASIGISSMNVTPQSGNPPFDVEIQVEVENTGNASGSQNVTVASGNKTIGYEVVELGAGSWTALTFDYTVEEKGDLEFSAGDQSVTVDSKAKSFPWIGVIALLLAILGAGYIRREELRDRLEAYRETDSADSDSSDDSREGDLDYTCDECGASFDSERGLQIHKGEVHKDED